MPGKVGNRSKLRKDGTGSHADSPALGVADERWPCWFYQLSGTNIYGLRSTDDTRQIIWSHYGSIIIVKWEILHYDRERRRIEKALPHRKLSGIGTYVLFYRTTILPFDT